MSDVNTVKKEEAVVEVVNPEEAVIVDLASAETTGSELGPLAASSLQHYDEATQKEILRIADEIDVTQFEKIMNYGSIPIVRSFESAGRILQQAQGTSAEQEVVKMVTELAKQAKDSYNLVIEEPNFFQKFIMKITMGLKDESKEVKVRAITYYKILEQYIKSCDNWLENLKKVHDQIMLSALEEKQSCYEIEQYLVAGYIAKERIEGEVAVAKQEWEETGLVDTKDRYDMLNGGLDMFQITLFNLEKSRGASGLVIGQLALDKKANENIQMSVLSQKNHSCAIAAKQLRNAYFNAVNREALEGQKAITKLNDELMKKVSQDAKVTAEESELILTNGVYTIEAAIEAAKTVMEGCNSIKKASEERVGKISADLDKLKVLVDELAPYTQSLKKDTEKIDSSKSSSGSSSGSGLVF